MAIDTIKSTAVLDGAIATADIADDAVTADKLANSINTSIAVGAAALPKAGGTMTGTIADFRSTGIDDNSNALAMTIDANENIGLGSVPATDWHSDYSVIQVGGQAGLWSHKAVGASKALHLTHNAEYDTGFKFIATDEATIYKQEHGAHWFSTGAYGTAGSAISFVEQIKIDADGLTFKGNTGGVATALDDYEEGTYNPVAKAGSTVISTTNQGTLYTKIGRQVNLSMYLIFGSSANISSISLPFTSVSGVNVRYTGAMASYNMPKSGNQYSPLIESNSAVMGLWQMQNNTSAVTTWSVDSNSEVFITITYFTAA
jgi:hypothetical protein